MEKTLGQLMLGSTGVFINGEDICKVSRSYTKNTEHFLFTFHKAGCEMGIKPAIRTVSEKKVLKIIKDGNFTLVKI